jgi:hypothetical protein
MRLFKKKKEETKRENNSSITSTYEEKNSKQKWFDNNEIIPIFKTWEELYSFLKDESKSLASKLEILDNINAGFDNDFYWIDTIETPVPDYIWKDTTLNRKIRALALSKSKRYNEIEALLETLDNELFLGFCELQLYTNSLLKSDKFRIEQKKQIILGSINFKKSYNRQSDCHEYTLLESLEDTSIDDEFKNQIYIVAKQKYFTTTKFISKIHRNFLNRFYKDETVSKEDKIKMIKKYLLDLSQGNEYSEQYIFYLGNENIPSYIQELVLAHFINAKGYNLENSRNKTFDNMNSSDYVRLLMNEQISDDLKLKFINATTNPVLLFNGMLSESLDDRLSALLKSKLETLKIAETKEFLNMLRTLVLNPETAKKRLLTNQEQI